MMQTWLTIGCFSLCLGVYPIFLLTPIGPSADHGIFVRISSSISANFPPDTLMLSHQSEQRLEFSGALSHGLLVTFQLNLDFEWPLNDEVLLVPTLLLHGRHEVIPAGLECSGLQADYTGLGAVVLNALMCRPWWKEDELAESLRLPLKPVRRILRLLETVSTQVPSHRDLGSMRTSQSYSHYVSEWLATLSDVFKFRLSHHCYTHLRPSCFEGLGTNSLLWCQQNTDRDNIVEKIYEVSCMESQACRSSSLSLGCLPLAVLNMINQSPMGSCCRPQLSNRRFTRHHQIGLILFARP